LAVEMTPPTKQKRSTSRCCAPSTVPSQNGWCTIANMTPIVRR